MEKNEIINQSLVVTKNVTQEVTKSTNAFFDFFRQLDYFLQGKRSLIFVWGAFAIVLIAPIIDYILLPRRLSFTSIATYLYLFFFIISSIAWAGKFRDENNNWSYKRFIDRIKLSFSLTKDTITEIRQKDRNSQLFISGLWIFVLGFLIKAFQNVSEIFRMPFQYLFGFKMGLLRTFESYTNLGVILIIIGVFILLYLHISKRIDLVKVFFDNSIKPHAINLNITNNSVINLKNKEQVNELILSNPDLIFRKTFSYLLEWKPKYHKLEDDYESDLLKFLSKKLRKDKINVENQYAIKSDKEIGRVDLSINKSIFIELKRAIKGGEKDRSMGQVLKYQRIIEKSNIPLILLIVDNNYNKILEKYTKFVQDYNNKHSQKILVAVVEPEI